MAPSPKTGKGWGEGRCPPFFAKVGHFGPFGVIYSWNRLRPPGRDRAATRKP